MFNLGLSEIVLISIIALIFIGPKQLPEIARTIGRALNELKRASEDLTHSIASPKNYEAPTSHSKIESASEKRDSVTAQNSESKDSELTAEEKNEKGTNT